MNSSPNYESIQPGEWTIKGPDVHDTGVEARMVNSQNNPPVSSKRMKGKYKTIFGSCALLTIPLLILVAILLVLVFYYRVQHNVVGDGSLISDGTRDENGVYYVDIQVSYLMKVASLTSTIATSLVAFAVVLAAYPLAAKILDDTQAQKIDELLTPYQCYLGLGLVEGASLPAIWRWISYSSTKKGKEGKQPRLLASLAGTAVITTLLGFLVFLAETWFHLGTKSYTFSQAEAATANFSNVLSANCSMGNNTYASQGANMCSIRPDIRGGSLVNPLVSLEVLNNVSDALSVISYNSINPPHAFLGIPSNGAPLKVDFAANTYSASTTCKPVTKDCGMSRDSLTNGVSVVFACPQYPAYWGDLIANTFKTRYFTNSSATENSTYGTLPVEANPIYFGINGHTDRAAGVSSGLRADPGVVLLEYGGAAYIFFCSTTVYDANYIAINGSITYFNAHPSNMSVATMFQLATTVTGASNILLQNSLNLGARAASAQAMADEFAMTYSRALVSLVAGSLQRAPATTLQQRSEFIVARVPRAPLYLLVAAIMLLLAYGLFITTVAVIAAQKEDIEEVRARFSLQGLVGEHLEPSTARTPVSDLDEVFEEKNGAKGPYSRVGIGRNGVKGGGWEVKIWQPSQPSQHV